MRRELPIISGPTATIDVLRWPVVGRVAALAPRADSRCNFRCSSCRRGRRPARPLRSGPRAGNLATVLDLGALSRAAGRRAAGRGQLLLRRLSVRARARLGPAPSRADALVAEAPARQVDRDRALRRRCCSPTSSSICGRCRGARRIWCSPISSPRWRSTLVFKGASFCKHLCPIGQFNFVASTVSPLELQIREPATCQRAAPRTALPAARSPSAPQRHRSAGLRAGAVSARQGRQHRLHVLPRLRAGVPARQHRARDTDAGGRARRSAPALGDRPALQRDPTSRVLAVLFVFGALLNAFAMTAPVHEVEQWLAASAGHDL